MHAGIGFPAKQDSSLVHFFMHNLVEVRWLVSELPSDLSVHSWNPLIAAHWALCNARLYNDILDMGDSVVKVCNFYRILLIHL